MKKSDKPEATEKPEKPEKPEKRNPPGKLSTEAQALRRKIVQAFEIDDPAGQLLLDQAMESFDRIRQAQAQIICDGLTITDRFGQPKPHPASFIERDARTALVRCLRSLNLDVEVPQAKGKRL